MFAIRIYQIYTLSLYTYQDAKKTKCEYEHMIFMHSTWKIMEKRGKSWKSMENHFYKSQSQADVMSSLATLLVDAERLVRWGDGCESGGFEAVEKGGISTETEDSTEMDRNA